MNEKRSRGPVFALLVSSTLLCALSLVFLTCFITDRFNTAMAFINNPYTKILLLWSIPIFAVVLVLTIGQKLAVNPVPILMSQYAIAQIALAVLVIVDRFVPSAILFTREPVKILFAAASLLGIAVSVTIQVMLAKREKDREN